MQKPKKPYPDFPLFPHARGYWAKCIKRKFYYFGKWDDPDGALAEYERVRHDLHSGRTPSPKVEGDTLRTAINLWLDDRKTDIAKGELSEDTWKEYRRMGRRVIACLGDTLPVAAITPEHLTAIRNALMDGFALKSGKNNIRKARILFNWLYINQKISSESYKGTLRPPTSGAIRREKANKAQSQVFTADEVRSLIAYATGYMIPGVYLGINCGFGNRDLVKLKWKYIDKGYVTYDRPKTGVTRRASLWPETIKALTAWRTISPESEFVCCGLRGQQLGGSTNNTPIPHLFTKIAKNAGVELNGRGFYELRHTYRTIADACKDIVALDLTMGHSDTRMGSEYTHGISDSRLDEIAELVRGWLYPK